MSRENIRIALLGPANAGKTTLSKVFANKQPVIGEETTTTTTYQEISRNIAGSQQSIWLYDVPGKTDQGAIKEQNFPTPNPNIYFLVIGSLNRDNWHYYAHKIMQHIDASKEDPKPLFEIFINYKGHPDEGATMGKTIERVTDWMNEHYPTFDDSNIHIGSALNGKAGNTQKVLTNALTTYTSRKETGKRAEKERIAKESEQLQEILKDIDTGEKAIRHFNELMTDPLDIDAPFDATDDTTDLMKFKKNTAIKQLNYLIEHTFNKPQHVEELFKVYIALQTALKDKNAQLALIAEGRLWPHRGQGPTYTYQKMSDAIAVAIVKLENLTVEDNESVDLDAHPHSNDVLKLHGRWQTTFFHTSPATAQLRAERKSQNKVSRGGAQEIMMEPIGPLQRVTENAK